MKAEQLSDAIGNVNEKMVKEADALHRKKRKPRWIAWVAAAACIAVVVALTKPLWTPKPDQPVTQIHSYATPPVKPNQTILYDASSALLDHKIASALYPVMLKQPNYDDYADWEDYYEAENAWYESKNAYYESITPVEDQTYFNGFYRTTALEFLSAAGDENLIYSPSNVYMALAMLAEMTDGQSRQQILDLLGAQDIAQLRKEANYLWSSNYCDDGVLTTVMANSVWLDESLSYRQETMDLLSQEYYASSYYGQMGSEEYNVMLRYWLNEQTGNLLEDHVNELSFDPSTVMALASTIYFKGGWTDDFLKSNTKEAIFRSSTGDELVDFMYAEHMETVYWGDSYTAVEKGMDGGASMWLILPDEGKSVSDVLKDGQIFDMTSASASWKDQKKLTVHLAMPKFDVDSNISLVDPLINLGITDVFNPTRSDFTPMSDQLEGIYVSEAEHTARVVVDEEGCTAAAYTVLLTESAMEVSQDSIEFVLDRPFIFVISGCGDQPLFIGIVNQMG